MQVLSIEVTVGEVQEIGGLSVIPVIGVQQEGPPHLTGPEAFEAGLLEVSELDPPQVPSLMVTNTADVRYCWSKAKCWSGGIRTAP